MEFLESFLNFLDFSDYVWILGSFPRAIHSLELLWFMGLLLGFFRIFWNFFWIFGNFWNFGFIWGIFGISLGFLGSLMDCWDFWDVLLIFGIFGISIKGPVNIYGNMGPGNLQRDYRLFWSFSWTGPPVILRVGSTGPRLISV